MMESDICKIFEGVFFKIKIGIRFFEQVSFMLLTKFSKLRGRCISKDHGPFFEDQGNFSSCWGCIFQRSSTLFTKDQGATSKVTSALFRRAFHDQG